MGWDIYRLSLPKLCQLLQAVQPTPEDWKEALPDEGEVDVSGIGTALAEKRLGRNLCLTWKQHLITGVPLWLVDATEADSHQNPAKLR